MARGRNDLVGHLLIPFDKLVGGPGAADNVVLHAKSEVGRWVHESTMLVGHWRAVTRSTYIQWALALNGLHVAADRYNAIDWENPARQFIVKGLRGAGPEGPSLEIIKSWGGKDAASAHLGAVPMLAAWGLIDLYACLEELVFAFYRVYVQDHPDHLLKGADYKHLRKLRREAAADPVKMREWEVALKERLDKWQRKKMYDGLGPVFVAYFASAGLKRPASFGSGPEQWAETIDGVALLRNCLVHGESAVPKELADFSGKPNAMTFDFKVGAPLEVNLIHLQGVEQFLDQLLTAINVSLLEHADAGA